MVKSKRILSLVLAISLWLSLFVFMPITASAEPDPELETPIYLDTSYSFAERAADLISRMSLSEKASQMISSQAPAIPRLGIPAYGWWNEALHGVARLQLNASGNATTLNNTTSYPIDLSLGSTWDPELMYREAVMISDEAREVVPDNRLALSFWSPTINLARDPRWGRNDESYGEDPFLTTQIASQFVNGMEGKDMNGNLLTEANGYLKSITTLKHYAANNSEVNRLNGTSNMDERSLREYYTAAFRDIVKKADVQSVMTSYNRVNGVPSSASVYLMDTLLRQTWGFSGYFTSDCDSVMEISSGHKWIPPGWTRAVTQVERTAFAMSAGEDLNCNAGYSDGQNYRNTVPTAIAQNITTETGMYTVNDVDTSLLRLFTARMQLGEFDDPNNVPWVTEARERVPQGTWTNSNNNNAITETPERLAMAREVGAKSLVLLKNSDTTRKDGSTGKLLPLEVPSSGALNIAIIGYFANPNSMYLGGYSSIQGSTAASKLVNAYDGIKNAIQAVNPNATVTYYKGFTGTGTTAANLTTVDSTAVTAAAEADMVIVYVGTDSGTANESGDRANITLPGAQASLIKQVAQVNPNTIAVMETIGMMDVTTFEPYVSTMLWSCYNGQRKGEALADVLLGVQNPSGHLPFIWYQSNSQIGTITDYTLRPTETNAGRTYMYFDGPLSYPFGHGLSYTTFAYSNIQIDKKNLDASDTFQVSVDVTNTGDVKGDEVVQLYINTPDAPADLERPIKRLRGFQKVTLDPEETKTVTLSVKVEDLAFFNEALNRYVVDNGRYGVQISKSSADTDIQIEDFIQVTGTLKPVLNVVTVKPTQEGDQALDIPTRVIFDKNKIVTPKITVAMNDETLYGYINKSGSKPFPEGMTFQYSSNRPEAVSVDENGVIRTAKSGVATITATVTYEGVSKSADFIVYVNAQGYIDGINIDENPLEGFAKDCYNYSIEVPYGVNDIPVVSAVNNDLDVTVTVTQASSIPGVATIVTQDGSQSQTYKIGFGHLPVSSGFTTGDLDEQWSILNEDGSKHSFVENGLQIATQVGDFNNNSVKNVFLQQAAGDWLVESNVKLSATPSANYQQAGLVIYDDNNNYLKLDYERNGMRNYFRFYNTSDGTMNQVGTATSNNRTNLYFRLNKAGSGYTAYYSTDGITFLSLGSTMAHFVNPRIGLLATNGSPSTAGSINAIFSYLEVLSPSIESVNPVDIITATGIAPELPLFVTAVYDDGASRNVGVTWDSINPLSYAQAGNFTVEGAVDGISIKAIANVTVANTATATLTGPVSVSYGEIFSLTYGLKGVQDIMAQKVTISYDSSLLNCLGAVPAGERTTVVEAVYDDASGTAKFIIAHLGGENKISGTADVLNIQFSAEADGPCIIEANAELGNVHGNIIYADSASATVVVDADKTHLASAIDAALLVYDEAEEGLEVGQYPAGTKDRILMDAIEKAQAVLEGVASSEEVAQAIADLNDALIKFQNLVITPTTGDINNIPGYDIGDIALVAYYYGMKAEDPGWDAIKHADINGDGEIGLYELAFIARKIMNK